MKVIEYVYGLFPYFDFSYPEVKYEISILDSSYSICCHQVVLLIKTEFDAFEELSKFYNLLNDNSTFMKNKFPYYKDKGIIINFEFFRNSLLEHYKDNNNLMALVRKLAEDYYYFCFAKIHDFDEIKYKTLIDYLNESRDIKGMEEVKKDFFTIAQAFHDYITILRSPYINTVDVNHLYLHGLYSFFCDSDNKILTKTNGFPLSCWEPKTDGLGVKVKEFFEKQLPIEFDDLFMAKAKTYLRLDNYSMAIIHAVIALEIIIPKFINHYLKVKGVNSEAINDFNHKFGLSVRVKALLKIMLPSELHPLLTNVAKTIEYRNKIMHEGKTNTYFEDSKLINKLIEDCEQLIKVLKKLLIER